MTELLVGQTWSDNDPRVSRHIEIIELPTTPRGKVKVMNTSTGRVTQISQIRFQQGNRMTGYTLLTQPSGWERDQEDAFLRAKNRLHGMPIGDMATLNKNRTTVTIPLSAFVKLGEDI
jgi:hypothetical protein